MDGLATWLPIVLGGIIVLAVCYKVFTDPAVNNYLGYAFVVAVILCALPTVQNFTYKGQLGELSGQMKSAVAGQSANLSGDINELSKKLDSIIKKVNATAEVQAAINPEYTQNKTYQVLVYYAQGAAERAAKVRDLLLNSGYKSSVTYTDFAELALSPPKAGTARIVFTQASASVVTNLRAKLRQTVPTLTSIEDRIVDKMSSGDVQILLF